MFYSFSTSSSSGDSIPLGEGEPSGYFASSLLLSSGASAVSAGNSTQAHEAIVSAPVKKNEEDSGFRLRSSSGCMSSVTFSSNSAYVSHLTLCFCVWFHCSKSLMFFLLLL